MSEIYYAYYLPLTHHSIRCLQITLSDKRNNAIPEPSFAKKSLLPRFKNMIWILNRGYNKIPQKKYLGICYLWLGTYFCIVKTLHSLVHGSLCSIASTFHDRVRTGSWRTLCTERNNISFEFVHFFKVHAIECAGGRKAIMLESRKVFNPAK